MSQELPLEQQRENLNKMIEREQKFVDDGDRLKRLLKNEDFKAVILEGYIKDEAVRLTKMLGDANVIMNPEMKSAVIHDIGGIGSFDAFLRAFEQRVDQAISNIDAAREELDRIDDEEDQDGTEE